MMLNGDSDEVADDDMDHDHEAISSNKTWLRWRQFMAAAVQRPSMEFHETQKVWSFKAFLADRFILSMSYNAESRDRQMWAAMQPFHFTDIGMCSIISPDMVFKDKVFILCSIKQRLCKNG